MEAAGARVRQRRRGGDTRKTCFGEDTHIIGFARILPRWVTQTRFGENIGGVGLHHIIPNTWMQLLQRNTRALTGT